MAANHLPGTTCKIFRRVIETIIAKISTIPRGWPFQEMVETSYTVDFFVAQEQFGDFSLKINMLNPSKNELFFKISPFIIKLSSILGAQSLHTFRSCPR
jgi:hypothetical protein